MSSAESLPAITPEDLILLRSKIDQYQILEETERCEDSLFEFVKGAWSSIDSSEFKSNWAIEAFCLPATAEITTQDGPKTIREIVDSDWSGSVLSYSHTTSRPEWKPIVRRMRSGGKPLLRVQAGAQVLRLTENHPVFVVGKWYVRADQVNVGDKVLRVSRDAVGAAVVESVEREVSIPEKVYNLEVLDNHNYFADGVLVHNCDHLEAVTLGYIPRLLANYPPRASKPVWEEEWVIERSRGRIKLKEVLVGDYVLTAAGAFGRVSAVHHQGILPLLKLTTDSGRSLRAASDHPVLTTAGWLPLGSVHQNDFVAVVMPQEPHGNEAVSADEARLIGYLIGDGSLKDATQPRVTTISEAVSLDIEGIVARLGFFSRRQKQSGRNCWDVVIKSHPNRWNTARDGEAPFRTWLTKYDLIGKDSYTKRVPSKLFGANPRVIAEFIGAYWSADGYISIRGPERSDCAVGCDSVSRELMLDMQHLLNRLGIFSRLRRKEAKLKTKRQGDTYVSWSLQLAKGDDVAKFAQTVRIVHEKSRRFDAIAPNMRRSEFDRPLRPDRVISVEPDSPGACRCLTVDGGSPTFSANDIAVHNTTIASICWPAWTWARRQSSFLSGAQVRFLSGSYNERLSLMNSNKTRRLILSPWFQLRWGNRFFLMADQNTKNQFDNTKGGSRISTSVRGSLLGLGGDIICFPHDEIVQTEHGPRTIGSIVDERSQIRVWSFDTNTGKSSLKRITGWHRNPDSDIVRVRLSDGSSFRCTPDHKIWTRDGWVRAIELRSHHVLPRFSQDGTRTPTLVEFAGHAESTYCVTVADNNTFVVGSGDVIVSNCIDDPHNTETEKVVETDADRNLVENWFKEIRGTRLNDPKQSAIVVVMQRLHQRDLSGVILDGEEKYTHLMIPMEFDSSRRVYTVVLPQYDDPEPWTDPRTHDGELMWPERFGPAEIARMKTALGVYMAAGRLQQSPVPKGGGIVQRDWWQPWDMEEARKYGLEWQPNRKEFPPFELVVASLDTSFGEKQENDFNALTVWGIWIDRNRNRRAMLAFGWNKRLPLHGRVIVPNPGEDQVNFKARQKLEWGLVELVADTCKRYKVQRLLIENKARGYDVAMEINRLYARENWGVELLNPQGDKVSRTHSVVPLFTDNAIWAPDTAWADAVITQCANFPKDDHDDMHDTVTQFLDWARRNGLLVRADEMASALEDDMQLPKTDRSVAAQYGV